MVWWVLQYIPVTSDFGAAHVKSFDINGDTFLAFANYRNGNRAESHNIDSFICKWNGSKFDLFQSIPTLGAFALYPFIICGQTYLTAVNYYDGEKNFHRYSTTSDVYQFSGEHFIKYQEIPTQAVIAVTKFDFKNQVYLVITSYYNEIENKYRINSNLSVGGSRMKVLRLKNIVQWLHHSPD